jgi:prepilin-type N-terminal cleavage/methylation domain-containing protein
MNRQRGFTLVEIAIVLVIIGLLLGGILKGQELINSARVRNLADTSTGVQAAYYGFIDRYRRIPGDWNASGAALAIGVPISDGGDDDGQIDNVSPDVFTEPNAIWVQLAAAGFIQGSYAGGAVAPTNANGVSPLNAFNNVMIMGRTADFLTSPSVRLHLVIGRGIPVDVMRELDQKVDDSNPNTGDLRATVDDSVTAAFGDIAEQESACVDLTNQIWNVTGDSQSCNAVYLF